MQCTCRTQLRSSHTFMVSACLGLIGLHANATAQDTRSTLARLVDESSTIAQVRVLDVRADGLTRRVTFKTRQLIKGAAPSSFTLVEPYKRSCGSALYGTLVSTSYLAFLTGQGNGLRLTVGSARALIPLTPATLLHIRALSSLSTSEQRLALAVSSLSSTSARIRQDSAATLARARDLSKLPYAQRWECMQVLGKSLGKENRVAVELLQVIQRLQMKDAVDVLVPHFLAQDSRSLQAVLLKSIPALDQDRAVRKLKTSMPKDIRGIKRSLALLGQCHGPDARRCIEQLTQHKNQTIAAMARMAHAETVPVPDTKPANRVRGFRSILQSPRK